MNSSTTCTIHSGRSQCTAWPVSGYTLSVASGIAAARRSCSSRTKKASCSPHTINVGATMSPSRAVSSTVSNTPPYSLSRYQRREELFRHWMVDRALLDLPNELGRDRIFQCEQLLPYLDDGIVVRQRRWQTYQDEAANAGRVAKRHSLREQASRGRTDDGRLLDSDCPQESIRMGSVVILRVTAFGLVRVSVTALVEREGMILR